MKKHAITESLHTESKDSPSEAMKFTVVFENGVKRQTSNQTQNNTR